MQKNFVTDRYIYMQDKIQDMEKDRDRAHSILQRIDDLQTENVFVLRYIAKLLGKDTNRADKVQLIRMVRSVWGKMEASVDVDKKRNVPTYPLWKSIRHIGPSHSQYTARAAGPKCTATSSHANTGSDAE